MAYRRESGFRAPWLARVARAEAVCPGSHSRCRRQQRICTRRAVNESGVEAGLPLLLQLRAGRRIPCTRDAEADLGSSGFRDRDSRTEARWKALLVPC